MADVALGAEGESESSVADRTEDADESVEVLAVSPEAEAADPSAIGATSVEDDEAAAAPAWILPRRAFPEVDWTGLV